MVQGGVSVPNWKVYTILEYKHSTQAYPCTISTKFSGFMAVPALVNHLNFEGFAQGVPELWDLT